MVEQFVIKQIYDGYNIKKLFSGAIASNNTVSELISARFTSPPVSSQEIHDFSRVLFPIAVNPSRPEPTRFIIDTFVFGNENDVATGNDLQSRSMAINYDKNTLEYFVDEVISRAKALDAALDDPTTTKTQSIKSYQIIEGSKGVGKTHLQNYILSKYSKKFDANNILWVRINLVRNFGESKDISLMMWAKCQIAKILLRYYDPSSEYYSGPSEPDRVNYIWRAALQKFVDKNYSANIEILKSAYQAVNLLINRMQIKENDQDIQPSWMPEDVVDEIFRIARAEMNLTIILVIDGLDLLTETRAAKKKYENRVRALENFLSMETPLRMYSLVFMQQKTLATMSYFRDSAQSSAAYHFDPKDERRYVCSCSIETLYAKRIQHLASPNSVIRIDTSRLQDFIKFVELEKSDILGSRGQPMTWLQLIRQLARDNARTATQVLSSLPNVFEERQQGEHRRKESRYKFIELAMLGRRAFPAKTYSYLKENGNWCRDLDDIGHIYDTMFLPAIFSFPYDRNADAQEIFGDPRFDKYIWTFRALQVIERYCVRGRRIGAEHICEILEIVFGYEIMASKLIIEELAEAEVIGIEPKTMAMAGFEIFGYTCVLTSKGSRIINSFVHDISYLALNLFTTPLPGKLVDDSSKPRSGFVISSPRVNSLKDWIIGKVVNGLSMMKIISIANEDQRVMVIKNRDEIMRKIVAPSFDETWSTIIADFMENNGWFFRSVNEMESYVLSSATRTINGFDQGSGAEEITRRIVRYW